MSNMLKVREYGYLVILGILISCSPDDQAVTEEQTEYVIRDSVVCYSLFAKPLKYPRETKQSFARKDSQLQIAYENYKADSRSLDNIIWYGRRLGYLSEYPKAMSVYTRGLHLHPESPEIYRHRGHRYISMRRFDEAANDLREAARHAAGREIEIEPDGIPNKLNQPLSSLQFNIWYHLGLAEYLQGNYHDAAVAYDSCMVYSTNNDLLCATTEWYYWTAIRSGDTANAEAMLEPITRRMEIVENDGYHDLLLLYKGLRSPEDLIPLDTSAVTDEHAFATKGYGVAQYLKFNGRNEEAKAILRRILDGPAWASFGYIAAEADISRGY